MCCHSSFSLLQVDSYSSHCTGWLLSELFFHSRTDHPSCRKALSWGKRKGASLLFCLLLLVAEAEFKVVPGAVVSPGTQRGCCREILCAAVRAPLFVVSRETLTVANLQISISTAGVIVVRLQLYLLAIRNFCPGGVAGKRHCSSKIFKGFLWSLVLAQKPGIVFLFPEGH